MAGTAGSATSDSAGAVAADGSSKHETLTAIEPPVLTTGSLDGG